MNYQRKGSRLTPEIINLLEIPEYCAPLLYISDENKEENLIQIHYIDDFLDRWNDIYKYLILSEDNNLNKIKAQNESNSYKSNEEKFGNNNISRKKSFIDSELQFNSSFPLSQTHKGDKILQNVQIIPVCPVAHLRGVIINTRTNQIVCRSFEYTPEKVLSTTQLETLIRIDHSPTSSIYNLDQITSFRDQLHPINQDNINQDNVKTLQAPKRLTRIKSLSSLIEFYKANEATIIRVFTSEDANDDRKLHFTTHRKLTCENSKWGSTKTFLEMLNEAAKVRCFDLSIMKDKVGEPQRCFVLLLVHQENQIVNQDPILEPIIYHLTTWERTISIDNKLAPMKSVNIDIGLPKPEKLDVMDAIKFFEKGNAIITTDPSCVVKYIPMVLHKKLIIRGNDFNVRHRWYELLNSNEEDQLIDIVPPHMKNELENIRENMWKSLGELAHHLTSVYINEIIKGESSQFATNEHKNIILNVKEKYTKDKKEYYFNGGQGIFFWGSSKTETNNRIFHEILQVLRNIEGALLYRVINQYHRNIKRSEKRANKLNALTSTDSEGESSSGLSNTNILGNEIFPPLNSSNNSLVNTSLSSTNNYSSKTKNLTSLPKISKQQKCKSDNTIIKTEFSLHNNNNQSSKRLKRNENKTTKRSYIKLDVNSTTLTINIHPSTSNKYNKNNKRVNKEREENSKNFTEILSTINKTKNPKILKRVSSVVSEYAQVKTLTTF